MKRKRHTVISLFSGALGLDIGLARTGRFQHLACVELDNWACQTIRTNRDAGRIDPGRLYEADVVALDEVRVMGDLGLRPGDLDLLCGGAPCPPYSSAGNHDGVWADGGLLPWHMVWYIEAMRPKTWIIENVPGLLSARLSDRAPKGSVLDRFLRDIPDEYRVDTFSVNAADYGTPQIRERILLVGNRMGGVCRFPDSTHGPAGSGLPCHRTLRDALKDVRRDGVGVDYGEPDREVYAMIPPGGDWRDLPTEVARAAMKSAYGNTNGGRRGWYRRLAWDEPSPTLLARANRTRDSRCHPDETRPLTVREYARIQGFDDDWEFRGPVTARYRQIGNAVPPRLGEAAGVAVARLLDDGHASEEVPRFHSVDLRVARRG